MKSLIKSAVALSLLTFASAPFAQDDVEEEGGFFSGIADFFTGLFSSDDDEDEGPTGDSDASFEWYAGGQYGATKYEDKGLTVAGGFGYYAGASMGNRFGAEVGYFDFGAAEVKGSGGDEIKTDGLRGMLTAATEVGDAPVRFGLGYYNLDVVDAAGLSETAGGISAAFRFEQAVTSNLFLTLGTDLFFSIKPESAATGTDAVVFSLGLSFHTDPPVPAMAEDGEDGGVGVTPVDGYGSDDYGDYGGYGDDSGDSGAADDGGGDDSAPAGDDYGDYDYGGDSGDDAGGDDSGGDASGAPSADDYGDFEDALPE